MTQIIAFEGLSPTLIPWLVPTYVRDGLLNPLALTGNKDVRPNVSLWRGSFMSSGPEYLRGVKEKIIVIGHSMGGVSAIAWCNRMADSHNIDLLLTLDPRPLHRPYVKPPNVKRAVNIYQRGFWMPGYPVEGAENHIVTCGHTAVPGHEIARKVLINALSHFRPLR